MNNIGTPPVTLRVGDLTAIASVITHLGSETVAQLEVGPSKFGFRFTEDDGEARYNGEFADGAFQFRFFNHRSNLGEGVFEPQKIGSTDNEDYFFTYYTNLLTEGARRFEFILYSKKK